MLAFCFTYGLSVVKYRHWSSAIK